MFIGLQSVGSPQIQRDLNHSLLPFPYISRLTSHLWGLCTLPTLALVTGFPLLPQIRCMRKQKWGSCHIMLWVSESLALQQGSERQGLTEDTPNKYSKWMFIYLYLWGNYSFRGLRNTFLSPSVARLLLWVLAQKLRLEFSPSNLSWFCCISEKAQITNKQLRLQNHNFHCQIKKGSFRHHKNHFLWASWTCL